MGQNIVEKSKEKYLLYEKRHQDILDSAIFVFNAKGYKAATTAVIAKKAGISEPTMYKHFKNKKDLFLACFNSVVGYLFSENKKIYKQYKDDEIVYFRGITKNYFDFVVENPDKSMFLVHMLSYQNDPEFRKFYLQVMRTHKKHLETIFKSAKKKGKIKSKLDAGFLGALFASQYFTVLSVREIIDEKFFKFENFFECIKGMIQVDE